MCLNRAHKLRIKEQLKLYRNEENMNLKDLYEGEEINGASAIYMDENCTVPYTGHVEDYFQGKISWECDIVNGLKEGIEKNYYDFTGELESVNEMKDNSGNGLSVEYYKNGKIKSISTVINDLNIDSYLYDEDGNLVQVSLMKENGSIGINYAYIKDKLPDLREKYDLEKMNREILESGKLK